MAEILETVEPGSTHCGESETPSTSSCVYHSSRIEGLLRSRTEYETAADFEIAASKVHWSELRQSSSAVESSCGGGMQEAAPSNREIVESLWRQVPRSWFFFWDSGDDVQLGRKIAEGGQAEIFEGCFRGSDTVSVFKVFKKGSSLLELQQQWPAGMLQGRNNMLSCPKRKFYSCCWPFLRNQKSDRVLYWTSPNCSPVYYGTLLMNGRFAFVMARYAGDLRTLIDMRMLRNSNAAPFSAKELGRSMRQIAAGMMALHKDNVVHRDLKAANILIQEKAKSIFTPFHVDQFRFFVQLLTLSARWEWWGQECSVGVVGTRFWRALEILQGVKVRDISPDLFTKASDVYSYGMTCYEMITGQVPFEGVKMNDYDVVIGGKGLHCRRRAEPWICKLLDSCWHVDPNERPDFYGITKLLLAHESEKVHVSLTSLDIAYVRSKLKHDLKHELKYQLKPPAWKCCTFIIHCRLPPFGL